MHFTIFASHYEMHVISNKLYDYFLASFSRMLGYTDNRSGLNLKIEPVCHKVFFLTWTNHLLMVPFISPSICDQPPQTTWKVCINLLNRISFN